MSRLRPHCWSPLSPSPAAKAISRPSPAPPLLLPRSKALTALFSQLPVWLVLVFLVFAVGIYIRNRFFTYYIEIALGLLIALFYPRLANLFKQTAPSS